MKKFFQAVAAAAREDRYDHVHVTPVGDKTRVVLSTRMSGRAELVHELDKPYTDELERDAIAGLEQPGWDVRFTSSGVRAYGPQREWTRQFELPRTQVSPPADFDPDYCRPWYCQPMPDVSSTALPDPPKKVAYGGVGVWKGFRHPLQPRPATSVQPAQSCTSPAWTDDELDAIGA